MVFIMIRPFEQVPCLTVTGTCTMSHWHYDDDPDICRKWRPTGVNLAPFTKLLKPRWRDRRSYKPEKLALVAMLVAAGSDGAEDVAGVKRRWLSGDGPVLVRRRGSILASASRSLCSLNRTMVLTVPG